MRQPSRVTIKEVMRSNDYVLKVGFGNLQKLLSFESRQDYTTRREGWGSDIYYFDSATISTGYAPFGNVEPSLELLEKYEKKAAKTMDKYYHNGGYDYQKTKAKLDALINEFIDEAIKESENTL